MFWMRSCDRVLPFSSSVYIAKAIENGDEIVIHDSI